MRRAVIAVIVALMPAGAGVEAAAAPRDLNAAVEEAMRNPDSVRVARVRAPISGEPGIPGNDHLDDFVVVRGGRVDWDWQASMARTLAEAMHRFPAPEICPRTQEPRRIVFGVRFFSGDRRTTIVIYLAEKCFEFWSGRTFEGSAEMHDTAPRILALLKQAFPTDTTVRNLTLRGLISCEDYKREHPEAPLAEQPPEATRMVPPRYPKEAKKAKLEGRVVVEAMIGADGIIGEVKVLESDPAFDAAAVASVREWEFVPALDCDGNPIAAGLVIPVRFRL